MGCGMSTQRPSRHSRKSSHSSSNRSSNNTSHRTHRSSHSGQRRVPLRYTGMKINGQKVIGHVRGPKPGVPHDQVAVKLINGRMGLVSKRGWDRMKDRCYPEREARRQARQPQPQPQHYEEDEEFFEEHDDLVVPSDSISEAGSEEHGHE